MGGEPSAHSGILKQDTWPVMKSRQFVILVVASLMMAAAPPSAQYMPARGYPSAWDRFVEGTKRFLHDPLGRHRADPRALPPDLDADSLDNRRAGSVFAPKTMKRDDQVRQATATDEAPAKVAPPVKPTKPQLRSLFSRKRGPSRTVSEFMAEEKP